MPNSNLILRRKNKVISCKFSVSYYHILCKSFLLNEAKKSFYKMKYLFLSIRILSISFKSLNQIATQLNHSRHKLPRKLFTSINRVECNFSLALSPRYHHLFQPMFVHVLSKRINMYKQMHNDNVLLHPCFELLRKTS